LTFTVAFLYDVVTAMPHFLRRDEIGELRHPRSAATILDGLAEVDKSFFNPDGSFQAALSGATFGRGDIHQRRDCDGLYAEFKTKREAEFPDKLCEIALTVAVEEGEASVATDRTHILRAIAKMPSPTHGPKPEDCDCDAPPTTHEKYDEVSRALRGRFAASALRRVVETGGEMLERYLRALAGARKVHAHTVVYTSNGVRPCSDTHRSQQTSAIARRSRRR
jgi:hypothetical protein